MVILPLSSMSILAFVWAIIFLITFPAGPITSLTFSGLARLPSFFPRLSVELLLPYVVLLLIY